MPRPKSRVPALVHHRPSGKARVRIDGKDHYLGPYGSTEADEAYRRLVAEYLSTGTLAAVTQAASSASGITITELVVAYFTFAEGYYVKDGKQTGEVRVIRDTLRVLREHYGSTPAADFGPLRLKAVREAMIALGWNRRTVNQRIGRIKRMMKWAVENELVPASVFHGLQAVAGLRIGRSVAPEPQAVLPVETETVNATLPYLGKVVKAMVMFQAATGCRPGEVCILRPCDVNRDDDVWEYRPASHKTQHHGRDRVIYVGPKAQQVLAPFLDDRPADAYCFSPAEAEAERREAMHAARRTPISCGNKPGSNRRGNPNWMPGTQWTTTTYGKAIAKAVKRANKARRKEDENAELIPTWSPNRLRHSVATAVRKTFGLEASQVVLGHSSCDVSQVYAQRDSALGRKVAAEIG